MLNQFQESIYIVFEQHPSFVLLTVMLIQNIQKFNQEFWMEQFMKVQRKI